jgi:branched-chain amino acid transport system ATP-binding protein
MLSIRHLSVAYGITEILRDVSLDVAPGQILALLGGNGAGKTTLLRTLSGLLKPRAGTIDFAGHPITALHPQQILRRGLAQVPQGRFVWPGMTVHDNLLLGAVTRRNRREIRACLTGVEQIFPTLARRRTDRAGQLSGGEQQMLAIARALMARPTMLLMDEPSAGLSPRLTAEMIQAIRSLNRSGLAVLLVEQNIGVAAALADHAVVLAHGEIVLRLSGRDIASSPQIIDTYLGRSDQ